MNSQTPVRPHASVTPPPGDASRDVGARVDRILSSLHTRSDAAAVALAAREMMQHVARLAPDAQQEAWFRVLAALAKSSNEHLRKVLDENQRLKQPPHRIGVLETLGSDEAGRPLATVYTQEGLVEAPVSADVDCDGLVRGQRVALAPNGAVLGARGMAAANPMCEFDRWLDDGRILARLSDQQTIVLVPGGDLGTGDRRDGLRAGDLIEFDRAASTALRLAYRAARTREFSGEVPDVTRDQIGGLDDVWQIIDRNILGPLCHPDLHRAYGVGILRGALFTGPPGVGKSMVIKATARAILAALGLDPHAPVLFAVSGSSLLRPFVGEGPALVRAIAKAAEDAADRHGVGVVLLDDFEYSALHRGVGDRSTPAYSSLTASVISILDGLGAKSQRVVWMATANRSDLIDSALLRPGRFGTVVEVPRPGHEACKRILSLYLSSVPLADGLTPEAASEHLADRIFSTEDGNALLRIQFADAGEDWVYPSRIVSGAILAEAVRDASVAAITRDIRGGNAKPGGVRTEDLAAGLDGRFRSAVAAITPHNAALHYLGLPDDRRVVAVDRVYTLCERDEKAFVA